MKTEYTLYGNLYRSGGLIVFGFLIVFDFIDLGILKLNHDIVRLFIFFFIGLAYLWFHPDIEIYDERLEIVRLFGLIRHKICWNEVILFKKISKFPKNGLIGEYQRYARIYSKNTVFYKANFFLILLIKNYEDIIMNIEQRISRESIIEDPKYNQ